MRPVLNVLNQPSKIGERFAITIDPDVFGRIHKVQGVGFVRVPDVGVFSQLDEPVGPLNEQPAIAPGGKTIGREPIDPDISACMIRSQDQFAKFLETRLFGQR